MHIIQLTDEEFIWMRMLISMNMLHMKNPVIGEEDPALKFFEDLAKKFPEKENGL